jgi:hypothetical protein
MPDISGLISAQLKSNEMERQSGSNLMDTITSSIREQGQRSFQQDAIEFFKDGNVSPQRLQEFSRKYPNVAPEETWKVASAVASQAKAQKMNNYGKSLVDYWKEKKAKGETINQDDVKGVIPAEDVAEFMPHMEQLYKFFKPETEVFEKDKKYIRGGKDITPTWPPPKKSSVMKEYVDKDGNSEWVDIANEPEKADVLTAGGFKTVTAISATKGPKGTTDDVTIESIMKETNPTTGVLYTRPEAAKRLADLKRSPQSVEVYKKVGGEWTKKKVPSDKVADEEKNGWTKSGPMFKPETAKGPDSTEKSPTAAAATMIDDILTGLDSDPKKYLKKLPLANSLLKQSGYEIIEVKPGDYQMVKIGTVKPVTEEEKNAVASNGFWSSLSESLANFFHGNSAKAPATPAVTSPGGNGMSKTSVKSGPAPQKKLIGTKGGKNVYDLGNGKWQVGD